MPEQPTERSANSRDSSRAPILVIPGWAFRESSLRALRVALEGLGPVHTIAPDPDRLDDLRYSIVEAEGAPPVIVGWSIGGMLAIEAAATTTAPIAGLVLVGATPRFCSSPDFPFGVDEARVRGMRLGLRRDPARVLTRFYSDCAAPGEPVVSESSGDAAWLDLLRRGLDYLSCRDLRALLPHVEVPCVVIHGREDRIVPCAAGERLAEAIAASRWMPVEGVGHDVPLRRPELLAGVVEELGRRVS